MGVDHAGLTPRGRREMRLAGEFTRKMYRGRLVTQPSAIVIHAHGEPRTRQSAKIWFESIFPPDESDMEVKVNVTSAPPHGDNIMEPRRAGCRERLREDVSSWDEATGFRIFEDDPRGIVRHLSRICGTHFHSDSVWKDESGQRINMLSALKELTDM